MATLVIFAGHSTKAVGAMHNGLEEHRLAQRLVDDIIPLLTIPDNVVTHECDDNTQRGYLNRKIRIVNKQTDPNTLALDIHFNAYSDERANGTECIVYPKSAKGYLAGKLIHTTLMRYFYPRGIKETTKFAFLRKTKYPAVIVEVCFLTNDDDMKVYLRKREKIAKDIAKAINDYFRIVEDE